MKSINNFLFCQIAFSKAIHDPEAKFKGYFTERICIGGGFSGSLHMAVKSMADKLKTADAKEFRLKFSLYGDADCNTWEEECILSVEFN